MPEYDLIKRFEGFHKLQKGDKWGIADTNGKIIMPIVYDRIELEANHYLFLEKDSLIGLLEMPDFTPIFPLEYDYIHRLKTGFVLRKGKLYGFADTTGKVAIQPKYKQLETTGKYLLVSDSSFNRLKQAQNQAQQIAIFLPKKRVNRG